HQERGEGVAPRIRGVRTDVPSSAGRPQPADRCAGQDRSFQRGAVRARYAVQGGAECQRRRQEGGSRQGSKGSGQGSQGGQGPSESCGQGGQGSGKGCDQGGQVRQEEV